MAYRYRSRRSARKLAQKSRRNFIVTLVIIGFLIYATIQWILPSLIGGLGFIRSSIKPSHKDVSVLTENASLAPPVLNIPYEATNTAQIDVSGYASPNSKVKLYLDDESKETVDVSADGSFIFKDVSLSLGTNNIYAKSVDEKNKESLASKLIKVIYDNEKPSLTINEPEDNKTIQGGDKKVKISGNTEIGAQVLVNNSQIIVGKDGNFSSDQPLNEGDNNFNIKALDAAGNFTEAARRVVFQP